MIEMSNMKDNRILVTGGAGFIGSEVVKQLIKKNAIVISFLRRSFSVDQGDFKWSFEIFSGHKVCAKASGHLLDHFFDKRVQKGPKPNFTIIPKINFKWSFESFFRSESFC